MKFSIWTHFIVTNIILAIAGLQKICAERCPPQCVCKPADKSGGATAIGCVGLNIKKLPKELDEILNVGSVNLSQNGFPEVPIGLPTSVTKLDIRYNDISSLKSEGYGSLYNIEELYLDHNHVSSIQSNDFSFNTEADDEALPYLRKLGLSHNRIQTIQAAPFRSMPTLKALTLSHNKLIEVGADLLKGVSVLEFMDLSHNLITTVHKDAFKNLPALKYVYLSWNLISEYPVGVPMLDWLDLSHNFIQYINEDQKEDVYPVEILNLAHNPLVCDCKTRWLKELYDRREYLLKYINIPTREFVPTCAVPPNMAGDSWDLLGDDVFRCDNGGDEPDDTFTDDLGTLLHKDPAEEDFSTFTAKSENYKESTHEYIVNVMASVTDVEWNRAIVKWILDDPDGLCQKLYVQYYQIGSKDSTLLIAPVSSQMKSYTLNHLESETHYKACVLPATSKSEVPSSILSPMQCVQFVTETYRLNDKHKITDESNSVWKIPNSEEIAGYSKLIGFCFMVSVLITGACMFILEVLMYCYRLLCDTNSRTRNAVRTKSHTD